MLMVFYNLFDKLTLTKKFHHEVRSFSARTYTDAKAETLI